MLLGVLKMHAAGHVEQRTINNKRDAWICGWSVDAWCCKC
jgi:hypothetical protein